MQPARLLLAAAGIAAVLAGCGIQDPYKTSSTPAAPATSSTTTAAAEGHPSDQDGPSQPPAQQLRASALASTAPQALSRFAELYCNWTAVQLPQRARQLGAISAGQARAQALQLAARAAVLERYQVSNAGTVVAIASGQGAEQGRWAVVTNESTSGTGPYLGLPATSNVTWATVQHTRTGYVVSGWYPAS